MNAVVRIPTIYTIKGIFMDNIKNIIKIKNHVNSGHVTTIKEDKRKNNKTAKYRAIKRYEETEKKYGTIIEEMIKNGKHMSPILCATGMSLGYFRNFIRWKGQEWVVLLSENSKNFISKDAITKSKMGAEVSKKLRIDRYNNIPEEIKNAYNILFLQGKHLEEIKRILKTDYNTTEHYIDTVLVKTLGKPARLKQSGCNNPMYGKSPSKNSGIGAKGYIVDNAGKKIYFRSSLEMKVFYFLIKQNIMFSVTKQKIKYIDENNLQRTYTPDIEIENKLIEIKPSCLIETQRNQLKFCAAKKYCLENNIDFVLFTENDFPIKTFTKDILDLSVQTGMILVDKTNYDKIVKYL